MTPPIADVNGDTRERAYRTGGRIARMRMAENAPRDAEAVACVEAADILVVPGTYDRVHLVLDALEMPHTQVPAEELAGTPLRPDQLLVVNCPGHLEPRAVRAVRAFVDGGGSLFTTDWAIRHVLEPAFPGLVAFNERPTQDDVVRIEVRGRNRFLEGVMDGSDDPQWWLEASSFPIRVLDPDRVEVLIASRELRERYGEAPVAVRFRHGDGEVFHMISHYYLQRTELRNARHEAPASSYAAEKGVVVDAPFAAQMDGLQVGDVESAASSARFLANIVAAKKRSRWDRKARPGARAESSSPGSQ